jgi:hypothetical protein
MKGELALFYFFEIQKEQMQHSKLKQK